MSVIADLLNIIKSTQEVKYHKYILHSLSICSIIYRGVALTIEVNGELIQTYVSRLVSAISWVLVSAIQAEVVVKRGSTVVQHSSPLSTLDNNDHVRVLQRS